MYNKILDVVSTLTSDAEAAKQAAELIFQMVRADKQTNKVKNEPIVKDGVTYKFCCWSKMYYPEEMFTKGKTYTKMAYRIWDKINRTYNNTEKELYIRARQENWTNERFDEELLAAQRERNKKDMVETYESVREHGYTAEELQ